MPILTSYLEPSGSFTLVVKLVSNSHMQSKLRIRDLNLGNPSEKMQKWICKILQQSEHLWTGGSVTECITSMPVICGLSVSQTSLLQNLRFKYIYYNSAMLQCDLVMSSSERDSLNSMFSILCYFYLLFLVEISHQR